MIRVIKSFSYRVVKNLILPHVNLTTMTVGELKIKAQEGSSFLTLPNRTEIDKQSAFKPFRTVRYDTLKIYVKAHGFKVLPLQVS